jgi:glycosyltransferase involved in cell wall biosynthesis
VMGYTPKAAIYGAIAARRARVPRIVPMITGLGYAYLGGSRRDKVIRFVTNRLYARALRSSHAVVFHNKEDRQYLAQAKVLPPYLPAHVVGGSGVNLEQFGEVAVPPAGDGLTFLMIARLLKYKGVIEYCEAARAVRQIAPNARFLLVGPEEDGPGGLTAVGLAAWSDSVTYLGPQDDVRPYLARCHVFVLPSHDGEGLPRTVLEAMATGRPIITTDTRGCRETVDERVNGCLVPAGDSPALAEAMLSFIRRPDLIPAMARSSRQKAVRRFDVELVTRDMLSVLLGEPGAVARRARSLSRQGAIDKTDPTLSYR